MTSSLYIYIFIVALLYSSVGQAGATGYIAVFSLCGIASDTSKPTVLILNVMVACIGTLQYWRAGHISWRLFLQFSILAVPFAVLGGYVLAPNAYLQLLVGAILILSALRMLIRNREVYSTHVPPWLVSLPIGASIGLLSGLTATGGGIFLSPILIFFRWANTKTAAGVSAVFILVNSLAGLGGYLIHRPQVPAIATSIAPFALAGGTLGSYLGSRHLPEKPTRIALAAVLIFAGVKLLSA